jgi:hypothetical protein
MPNHRDANREPSRIGQGFSGSDNAFHGANFPASPTFGTSTPFNEMEKSAFQIRSHHAAASLQ